MKNTSLLLLLLVFSASQPGWLLPSGWKLEDPGDIGYNWHWAIDTLKGVYTKLVS